MMAQVQEIAAQAQELAEVAEGLRALVSRLKPDGGPTSGQPTQPRGSRGQIRRTSYHPGRADPRPVDPPTGRPGLLHSSDAWAE
jgi:hypothetical protein